MHLIQTVSELLIKRIQPVQQTDSSVSIIIINNSILFVNHILIDSISDQILKLNIFFNKEKSNSNLGLYSVFAINTIAFDKFANTVPIIKAQ